MMNVLQNRSLSDEAQAVLKKWGIVAAIIGIFSGGGAMTVFHFAADWVEMNSRPTDIVNTINVVPLISDDLYTLEDRYCRRFPVDC